MRDNDVLQARLRVDLTDGNLYAEYPSDYSGTTFSVVLNELYASTDADMEQPDLTVINGCVYAYAEEPPKEFNDYVFAMKSGKYTAAARLEFLQPDGTVAFSLGNTVKRGYQKNHDTKAFIQDGTLNVTMQNGIRRKATVKLANIDGAFSYNINKVWYGTTVRLLMGIRFADDREYMFPQGVFLIENPQETISPSERTVTYQLVDKWANLNGEHGGTFDTTYVIPAQTNGVNTNTFAAINSLLQLSRITMLYDGNTETMIDSTAPVFTMFYNGRKYYDSLNNTFVNYTDLPYEIAIDSLNGNVANALLELTDTLVALIGYDVNGALRIEPSQDDIDDAAKAPLWTFTMKDYILNSISETAKNTEVKNDVIISSSNLDDVEIWARASNYDGISDTNINLIGKRTYRESKSTYWNTEQCASLAEYELKKRCVLQKSIVIDCIPLYHLQENGIVAIQRGDKTGAPTENHLINSFSIPIAEQGNMQINATSVNDIPDFNITTATSAS